MSQDTIDTVATPIAKLRARFTPDEDQFLRDNWHMLPKQEIADHLQRPLHSVMYRACSMLGVGKKRGKPACLDFTLTCRKCGAVYSPRKSEFYRNPKHDTCFECINARRREMKVKKGYKHKFWTPEEEELIRQGRRKLPGRSAKACVAKAIKLGCARKNAPITTFTPSMIAYLKRWNGKKTTKEIAHDIGCTPKTLRRNRLKLGIPAIHVPAPKIHKLTDKQREQVPAAVKEAVPRSIPAQVREEVISMLTLDVLSGLVAFKDIAKSVKSYRTKVYTMFPEYGAPKSLDAKVFDDGETTLGDTISSDVNMWERAA